MKKIIFFLSLPLISLGQNQIGNDIYGEAAYDSSGWSVALSNNGNILAIGAPYNNGNGTSSGQVRVFQNTNNNWVQIGNDIDGESANDRSGLSVALSGNGNILAIGAPYNDTNGVDYGHVRVFQNINNNWAQIGNDIDGEVAGDWIGFSVALSDNGNILAIGAPYNDNGNGVNSGQTRVFQNINNNWVQIGNNINGETGYDYSGRSISLSNDGNILAIGAYMNDENGTESGHVRIYQNINNNWLQIGNDIDGESSGNRSGWSVSLSGDGNTVAIGAYMNDGNGIYSGQVRVYQNINNNWTQIGSDIDGETAFNWNGYSVALSDNGNILAIGAPYNDGYASVFPGYVRVFQNINNNWTQIGNYIDGETPNARNGWSVALSDNGNILAIGAPYNNSLTGTDPGGQVRVYDLSPLLSSDLFVLDNFSFYPNPSNDVINIVLNQNLQFITVNIYSQSGQLIKNYKNKTFNVKDLAKGTYYLEVITNEGKAAKTLIVQ